jgi:hypothetical protein
MALALSVNNSSEPRLPLFQPRDCKGIHKAWDHEVGMGLGHCLRTPSVSRGIRGVYLLSEAVKVTSCSAEQFGPSYSHRIRRSC